MSHNLNFNHRTGRYSCAVAAERGKPWHGLGQVVQGAMTWDHASMLAGLDWTVSKHQLRNPLTDAPIDRYAVLRDDTQECIGTVGAVWQPIQNKNLFSTVDSLLEAEGAAHYESAGALGDGNQVWCLARVPYDFSIAGTGGKDLTETYLMMTSAHDGTMSATCKLTTVRVVCQNTLNLALSQSTMSGFKVRHSTSGNVKLEAAKKLLSGVKQNVTTLKEKLDALARKRITKDVSMAVMADVFGKDWQDSSIKRRQITEIGNLFKSNDRGAIPEIAGTAYNMFNAMTEWSDHYSTVRVTSGKAGMTEQLVRQEKALFNSDGWKDKVLHSLLSKMDTMESVSAVKAQSTDARINSILDKINY